MRALLFRERRSSGDEDVFNEHALRHYVENLDAMISLCRERGLGLAFVAAAFSADRVAESGDVYLRTHFTKPFLIDLGKRYDRALRRLATQREVPVIGHRLAIGAQRNAWMFIDSIHPNARGYEKMSASVARVLREQTLIPSGPD